MGSMFRLGEDSVRPAAGSKIIKAEEYGLFLEADALLAAARDKSALMQKKAEEAYAQKKEEGYRDGIEEGKMEHAEKMMETILSSVEFIEGTKTRWSAWSIRPSARSSEKWTTRSASCASCATR